MAAPSASKRARPTPEPAPAPAPAPVAASIRLTVSDIAGEVRVIEVDENETVAHVKAVLEVEFAVPQREQLLLFETKKLENHQRLNAAGVKNDDMLMMQAVRDDGFALGGIGGPDSMRLNADPFNVAAQKQIEEMVRMQNVNANLDQVEFFSFSHRVKFPAFVFNPTEMRGKEMQAMEHNPEAFASVVMLYVDCEVNGFPVKAFVDSGAQVTIMSQPTAQRLGLMRLIDYRYAGIAKGVGTSKIVGRVHSCQMKIGGMFITISINVLEDNSMDFLFGLDNLRRHQMCIDLKDNVLRCERMQVPFLGEGDIPKHLMGMDDGGGATIVID